MQTLISLVTLLFVVVMVFIISHKLNTILNRLIDAIRKEEKTMVTMEELIAQVTENTALEASAIEMIQGLAEQIADNKDDPAKIEAITTSLKASAAALAAAILANTPQTIEPIPAV